MLTTSSTEPCPSPIPLPSESELASALGGALLLRASRRRHGAFSALLELTGLALTARGVAGPLRRALIRLGAHRRSIHLGMTLTVHRPVNEVFSFCRDFENFPRLIGGLHRVIDYEDGRSHWEVLAPSGEVVEWDAVVTKYVPNSVIAWESVAGSPVRSSGLVRFAPVHEGHGGTRLDVTIEYEPCTTTLDDAVHALMDVPRERQLGADLAHADFYFTSRPSAGGASPAVDGAA
jgi:uncharacterized membrane protein